MTQPRTAVLAIFLSLACAPLAGCGGPPAPEKKGPTLLEVRIDAPAPESAAGQLLEVPRLSHREVMAQISDAASDDHVRGLFLRIGELGGAWARVQDYRRAIAVVRKAGMPVHCYFEATDNLGYALLARSCGRISMTPAGLLNLVGLRAQAMYARKLLDELGLRAELLHVGKYKGAADSLTLEEMPDSARETMEDMLDDLHAVLVQAVVARDGIDGTNVQATLDGGPYTAHAALRAKLIDAVAFDDEARERARQAAKAERVERAPTQVQQEPAGLAEMLTALGGEAAGLDVEGAHVALVNLDGTIVRGDATSRSGAHAESFVKEMRRLADDDDVRAVVLRIHSPGGSAMASDLMWQAVRRVAGRKPVVASLGDMAASGGYYVAAGATEIVAEPGSLVGSIGVVGGKIVAADLAERAGVEVRVMRRGERAAWMSPVFLLTDSERQALQAMLDSTYRLFVRRVGQGRALQPDAVERVAQGRLMTGKRALDGKLVDALGGLEAALVRARELGDLPPDAEVSVWPRRMTFVQQLAAAMGGQAVFSAPSLSAMLPARLSPWTDLSLLQQLLTPSQGPAALLPYGLEIR